MMISTNNKIIFLFALLLVCTTLLITSNQREISYENEENDMRPPFQRTPNGITRREAKLESGGDVKRILVTGGAGFVGSHLVDSLMADGHFVTVFDNFHTGTKSNLDRWRDSPRFKLVNQDIIQPLGALQVDQIYHLASPASPSRYMSSQVQTIKTNVLGTINVLLLAKSQNARVLIASTSEVYGDPEVHPQAETYWGHVNPVGPRSCYDESKRLSETLGVSYSSEQNVSVVIARIFNTYGPRMGAKDGRVISNFIAQSINNKSLTVYGDGQQTRSFQYVTDLVEGLKKLMARSDVMGPINLGNTEEIRIKTLAELVLSLTNSSSKITYNKLPLDDPHKRRPDIRKAIALLDWRPSVTLVEGLNRTIEFMKRDQSAGAI